MRSFWKSTPGSYSDISRNLNSNIYLWIKDIAMRRISASVYTSIFMSKFGKKYLNPLIKDKSIVFLQFMDNTLIIWNNYEEELRNFRNQTKKIKKTKKTLKILQRNNWLTNLSGDKLIHPYSLRKGLICSKDVVILYLRYKPSLIIVNLWELKEDYLQKSNNTKNVHKI